MRLWRRFRKAQEGLAAVEFALLLPVLIALFFGTVEVSMALLCRADVSIMASTAADLIAQVSSAQSTDITNVFDAAGTILYPYYSGGTTGQPTIRITSINYDTTSKSTTSGKVAWTCVQSGSGTLSPAARSVGDTVTLPQAIMTSNGSVILAEIAYNYASPTTQMVASSINMTNVWYTKPRRVAQITGPSSCPA